MDTKTDSPSDDVISQNKREFFNKNVAITTNSDNVLQDDDDDSDVTVKTEIKSENPFTNFSPQSKRQCFTKQTESETVTGSKFCEIYIKTEIEEQTLVSDFASQNEREFLPEVPVMKDKKYSSDHETDIKIEIKEEPCWFEAEPSSVCDDIKDADFPPVTSPRFIKMSNIAIEEAADLACASVLPAKPKQRYVEAYNAFRKWSFEKNINSYTSETVLLAYFHEKSEKYTSPASLWCDYSMLRSTISLNDNVDISIYTKLKAFLKRQNVGYVPKKSEVFSITDISKFLCEAPDETFLLKKVVAIMGIAGACRKDELCKLTVDSIVDKGMAILVNISDSKNHQSRSFEIVDNENENFLYLSLVRKYMSLRPKIRSTNRFFLRYVNGKCRKQPVGRNVFAKIPSDIARFLNLPNSERYTGHSFRRMSTTVLADSGVNIVALKGHSGWKPSAIAESYVVESLSNKLQMANKIFHLHEQIAGPSHEASTSVLDRRNNLYISSENPGSTSRYMEN